MKKILALLLTLTTIITLAGCSRIDETNGAQESITFSDNILLSINSGAAGEGTLADCTDATIIIYREAIINGGYMAVSKEFGATYRAIHEIPASYKIKDIVNEYRATM